MYWADRISGIHRADLDGTNVEDIISVKYADSIAFDSFGDAIAAWNQFDGTRMNTWVSRFQQAWGTPEIVGYDDFEHVETVRLTTDGAGNAFVVWSQWDGAIRKIWANHYAR